MQILQNGDPVLREIAKEVPQAEITSPRISLRTPLMRDALATQYDGVALAAPQIGHGLRIFVVAEEAFTHEHGATKAARLKNALPGATGAADAVNAGTIPDATNDKKPHLVYINPVITKRSRDKSMVEEGCLSVRPLYGNVHRSNKVSIRAYDEHGNVFERGGTGLIAQIFQHETDHLDGILFIDRADDIWEVEEVGPNGAIDVGA
jgi:peptide deformylase